MNILEKLSERWNGVDHPFLIHTNRSLRFDEIMNQQHIDLSGIRRSVSRVVISIISSFLKFSKIKSGIQVSFLIQRSLTGLESNTIRFNSKDEGNYQK